MIQIPHEKVIEKLKEHGLSDEDISTKIKQKMDQLSGLISKEGAAHIIANELGVKLVEKSSGRIQIKDVLPGMRGIEVVGKVTTVFDVRQFQRSDGNASQVGSFILGDETGTIRVTCWGDQANNVSKLEKDMVVKVSSGYIKQNQGRNEIHMNDTAKMLLNPPGENIGDVSFEAREFDRKQISTLKDGVMNVELLATIVGVDALRFFEVCPTCKKRVRLQRDAYVCETHGSVEPDYSYVMNVVLDDGSANIRGVCFGDMVEKALSQDKNNLLMVKDTPAVTEMKNSLIGSIVKFKGRVKRNQMFDRLEFTCQDIDSKPDPYEEMEHLDKAIESAKEKTNVQSIDEI
ncbi:MAG: OB-fold nucleic acid binding domain-containing protein [Candidatus Woesearchaeota archaeon]